MVKTEKGFRPMRLIIHLLIIITIAVPAAAGDFSIEGTKGTELAAARVATFDEPWAMTFLPDGTLLVTEKKGVLWHVTSDGSKTEVQGLWKVAYGGQGGLGDVVLHPVLNAIPGSIYLMPNARMITPQSVRWWSAQSSI
jgi:hypothetical protein